MRSQARLHLRAHRRHDHARRESRFRQVRAFYQHLLPELAAIPGVRFVGALTNLPASNVPNPSVPFRIEGRAVPMEAELPSADLQTLAGSPLELFHVPLTRGRALVETDDADASPVVVVSESMARLHWPNQDPLGERLRLDDGSGTVLRVVGVASDVRMSWFDPEPRPTIYVSAAQRPRARLRWAMRGASDPYELAERVRERLRRLDPNLALAEPSSLEDAITESIAPRRTVRLAVYRLPAGVSATWIAARFFEDRLFGLFANDPGLVLSLSVLATAAALLATLGPDLRAAEVDPNDTLGDGFSPT